MSFNRLTWGVKASFRAYVEGMEGTIAVSDGATRNDDGAFVFEAIPGGDLSIGSDGSASGSMRFQGTVAFEAHGGMLKSTLSELGLEVTEDGLVLTVQDQMGDDRCAIAKVDGPQSETDGRLHLRTEITMDGMYQIADNYPPGTELDPITLD